MKFNAQIKESTILTTDGLQPQAALGYIVAVLKKLTDHKIHPPKLSHYVY